MESSFQIRGNVILAINTSFVGNAMEKEPQSQNHRVLHHAIHLLPHQMSHQDVYHVADHAYYVAGICEYYLVKGTHFSGSAVML